MKLYIDIENNTIVTETELEEEFKELQLKYPIEYNYTFSQYIKNCTSKNGFLQPIKTLCVCNQCLSAIESHEGRQQHLTYYIDNPIICDWCEEETYNEINILI